MPVRPPIATLALGMALCSASPAWGDDSSPREHEVKAAFVLRLALFTTWPAAAGHPEDGPFRVGVLGDDPVGHYLSEAGSGQTIHGRLVEVVPLELGDDLDQVQVLWIPRAVAARQPEILRATAGSPVLTIGEDDGAAARGTCIELFHETPHVRFRVNLEACERAGLTLSAKVLQQLPLWVLRAL